MADIDETEVTPAAEEPTTETELETPETEVPPTTEELADLRKKAKAFEDQRKRAENAETELKKLKGAQPPKDAQAPSATDQKRLDRIELNSLGIQNREDQDFVLGAAQRMGVTPAEAAADEFVSGRLDKMREARKTRDATPAPSRGGQATQNVTRLAEKALSTGELPSDPELRSKVKAEMARMTRR